LRQVTRDDDISRSVSRTGSRLGRGGMATKVRAAQLLMACGEMTVIAHARKHRLVDILDGVESGTLFVPAGQRMGSRKRWIGFASPPRGRVVVDNGAVMALTEQGRSLLPAGVTACEGVFRAGDVVRVEDDAGREVARGVSRYTADEVERILGRSSPEVEKILSRPALEIIHRDDLVLT
jgi:glutamate 5-kinase